MTSLWTFIWVSHLKGRQGDVDSIPLVHTRETRHVNNVPFTVLSPTPLIATLLSSFLCCFYPHWILGSDKGFPTISQAPRMLHELPILWALFSLGASVGCPPPVSPNHPPLRLNKLLAPLPSRSLQHQQEQATTEADLCGSTLCSMILTHLTVNATQNANYTVE